jgi:NDP-sugar pyrophosphorylase family protein
MQLSELRAMLVTAGFGTRLAPLTDRLPKPALPLANRPVAWFALDYLRRAGVRECVLNTHHLARELETEVRRHAPPEIALSFVHEPVILGTGGGIRNAWRPRAGETFLVMNGKLLFTPDLAAALRVHLESRAIATMLLSPVAQGDPLGAVEIDPAGRVRRLLGVGPSTRESLQPYLYASVCLLDARAHRDLPENGCLIRDAFRHWIDRGECVMGVVDHASFRDVGMSHWHYWESNMALATGRLAWPEITPNAQDVLQDPSAQLGSNARVVRSVLGAAARVDAGVMLEDCVVWPNTHVTRDHIRSVLLPDGTALKIVPQP